MGIGGDGIFAGRTIVATETATVIDVTDAEAFLVRKNGDTGDIFVVDTSTPAVISGGNVVLMQSADIGNANRSVDFSDTDPHMRVYSSDAAAAIDYIEIFHDQASGNISVGAGNFTNVVASGNGIIYQFDTEPHFGIYGNTGQDQLLFRTFDNSGNQIVVTSNGFSDHDHTLQTNPTLYIHSDTSPDSQNDEWVSITHDVTDGVIDCGSGTLNLGATGNVNFAGASHTGTGDTVTNGYVEMEVAGTTRRFATVA